MSQNKIQVLLSFVLILISWSISVHYASAKTPQAIEITQNYQQFIDFKKYPDFAKLYFSENIQVEIFPKTDIKIIYKDNALVFWVQAWIQEASADLHISVKDTTYTFPITLHIEKNVFDFSIQKDMYELSLQEKSLSCESAATADILESFYWKNIHEDDIIDLLPKWSYYNTLPEQHPWDVTIWGNPELWFVWYIDSDDEIPAKQKLMTGYGVYEAPISDIYQKFWLYTEIFNISRHSETITPKLNLQYLLEKLKSWSMVQLWWDWCTTLEYDDWVLENKSQISTIQKSEFISTKNTCYNIDNPRELTWKYYDNNWELVKHVWLDGEHAFILLWWKWDIQNPSHIRVWDTDTWYHLYPTHEWMQKWKAMDYRSIIITKKDS